MAHAYALDHNVIDSQQPLSPDRVVPLHSLRERPLVTEDQVRSLYNVDDQRYFKNTDALRDLGLLPLTLESLATPAGQAIVSLAAWNDFSGNISLRYKPIVCGKEEMLRNLAEREFAALGDRFKYRSQSGSLEVVQDGGAFGRLLVGMGLYEGDKRGKRDRIGLPSYVAKLVEMKPSQVRDETLMTILNALFKDRFVAKKDGCRVDFILYLNVHPSHNEARSYGYEIGRFINGVVTPGRSDRNLFHDGDVQAFQNGSGRGYEARIRLTTDHIGKLLTNRKITFSDTILNRVR